MIPKESEQLKKVLDTVCDGLLNDTEKLSLEIWKSFHRVVPERLRNQITGNCGAYLNRVVGMVIEEYVREGLLTTPLICDEPYRQVVIEHTTR